MSRMARIWGIYAINLHRHFTDISEIPCKHEPPKVRKDLNVYSTNGQKRMRRSVRTLICLRAVPVRLRSLRTLKNGEPRFSIDI